MNLKGFELIQTCGACPEQYEVFLNRERMSYLRLRHGYFYVAVPDSGGELIYEANPKGDGCFECDERDEYLQNAIDAIIAHYSKDDLIVEVGCQTCKTEKWTNFDNLFINCHECSPNHPKFHYLKPKYNNHMKNSIFILQPTRNRYGIWAFDDINTGLVQEPFVGDTNILIDNMVLEAGYTLEEASKGIALLFSPDPFQGHQSEIYLIETTPYGSTYGNDKWDIEPWLCPALYKYFPQAPQRLFSQVKH